MEDKDTTATATATPTTTATAKPTATSPTRTSRRKTKAGAGAETGTTDKAPATTPREARAKMTDPKDAKTQTERNEELKTHLLELKLNRNPIMMLEQRIRRQAGDRDSSSRCGVTRRFPVSGAQSALRRDHLVGQNLGRRPRCERCRGRTDRYAQPNTEEGAGCRRDIPRVAGAEVDGDLRT